MDNNVADDLLEQQLDQIMVDHPDYRLTKFPDLSSYMTCGFQQIIPLTATEFTADNVIQLFERVADDGLDIYQATEILRASCNANPSSVISVISDIANRIESKSEVLQI